MSDLFDFVFREPRLIGFNNLFQDLDRLMTAKMSTYPPYNIEKEGDSAYRIVVAVAGVKPDDLEIVTHKQNLIIRTKEGQGVDDRKFLHKGIADRRFELAFRLADNVEIVEADLSDGLLSVRLEQHVPEEAKPKVIPIGRRVEPPRIASLKSA